ncbi:MAG: GNAT family N-acetyltransferase [Pseudomonadota bacterium]
MDIRPARPADVAALKACAESAYSMYVERIGRKPAPMVADFAAQIMDGLVHVAADADDRVAGFVVFYPRDNSMHLENIAIDPAHQGTGLGRALVAFVEDRARAAGLSSVDLYTNVKMIENQKLYPRLGYQEVDRRTEDGFERIYYRKAL